MNMVQQAVKVGLCLVILSIGSVAAAQRENPIGSKDSKVVLIATNSRTDVKKILERLKNVDSSRYRLRVTETMPNGVTKVVTYGTASAKTLHLSAHKLRANPGEFRAEDTVVIVKNIFGKDWNESSMLKSLDQKMTKSKTFAVGQ